MNSIEEKIKTLIEKLGFEKAEFIYDENHRRLNLIIEDDFLKNKKQIPLLINSLDILVNLILRRHQLSSVVVDVNYYRKERERLITELARAAARKVINTKKEVELPPMNAYERRLVHLEIKSHPDLITESYGQGKERRVVIKFYNSVSNSSEVGEDKVSKSS